MLIVRDNPDQLIRLIDATKESPDFQKIILNSNLTEYDFNVLKSEIDNAPDSLETDDVQRVIDNQPESHRDILSYLLGSMDIELKNDEVKKHFEENSVGLRLIKVYKFSELSTTAKKKAIVQQRAIRKKHAPHESLKHDDIYNDLLHCDDCVFLKSGAAVGESND